jgi:hypothetical protein
VYNEHENFLLLVTGGVLFQHFLQGPEHWIGRYYIFEIGDKCFALGTGVFTNHVHKWIIRSSQLNDRAIGFLGKNSIE